MESKSNFRSSTYHLVIEEFDSLNNRHILEKDINDYLKEEMRVVFYAFIKHDSDQSEDGTLKRVHYHCVVSLNNAYSKNTIIMAFVNGLTCNPACISCRKVNSFVKSVQYLLHKNDKDKYQYDYLDIWTNDVNELNMCLYQSSSSYELDINYICELVKCSNSIAEIYKELGLSKARQYRSIIMDLYKEEHIEKYL